MAPPEASRIDGAPEAVPKLSDLARALEVLANENRLRLLQQLVRAKAVSEIDLRPSAVKKGENPERPISRQGIQLHLEKLASIGFIATSREHRGKGLVEVHSLNYPRLFALVEEMRALGELRPAREPEGVVTLPAARLAPPAPASTPQLVIVRGLHEGTAFTLSDENRNAAGLWLLGRKRGLAVCLDYDPFVSGENSEFRRLPNGAIGVRGLPASRNGTQVNWERLPPQEDRRLRHGDIVGAGRTLLLFREP